ncbi:MFS transporter [Rickettsia endosymbiont of Cardiosporidium cionae]|uniref:MFS transporter n=1 Tax=Rickettsia endosymbiont of Cardiosporidium cionae TaxID=2777155 RepID=UPI0018944993|nr:MFS transporter [Rickettsia endosymbiont of Cardiosporidium cionae]KAF8818271.1 MFS transporter [Rickettsia endosymbiont of Cardiosporidium cionae]
MNKRTSIVFSAIIGNILEYYDFTVFAVFLVIIGKTFFPKDVEYVQTIYSLAIFSVGFLTRPIGGIIFGFIGDRFGRRISLIISMVGMTIPTFVIGLIPSYEDIGFYAPLTLAIMRLSQGLCISGEGAGAAIFILEHYQNLRPGFTAGIVHASNIAGTMIASIIGIILDKYLGYLEFAWRYAFLLGGVMGLVGFYIRLRVSETPIFKVLEQRKYTLKSPFIHVIKSSWRSMFITFALGACASSIVYFVKVYTNIYYSNILHFNKTTSLSLLAYSSTIMMLTMPLFGHMSDLLGRFKLIYVSSIMILLLSLPTLFLMGSTNLLLQLLVLTILALLGGCISGTAYIFIISLFKPEERFSGVSFSYNLGIAMFGGTSAMISSWLTSKTGLYYSPAFYLMLVSAVFILIIHNMKQHILQLIDQNMNNKK